jgi:hypothetical protein
VNGAANQGIVARHRENARCYWRRSRSRLAASVIAIAACASPAGAQRESSGPFEIQVGLLAPTTALGTAEGYRVRLQAAPTLAFLWHKAGRDQMHFRAVLEATPFFWGRASPATGCVGYCRPAGFTALGASLGPDLVLASSRGSIASAYVALGARGRAYFLASNTCPAILGAFCAGNDALTEATIRPALAIAVGTKRRVGARRTSIEIGYLPTWVRSGQLQHDLRAVFGIGL